MPSKPTTGIRNDNADVEEGKHDGSANVKLSFQYPAVSQEQTARASSAGGKTSKKNGGLSKLQRKFAKQSANREERDEGLRGSNIAMPNLLPDLAFAKEDDFASAMNSRKRSPRVQVDADALFTQSARSPRAEKASMAEPLPFTESVKQLPDLKTSEEAIAFFARHREEDGASLALVANQEKTFAPLKFVTLNRAPAKIKQNPYDLVVVEPAHINPDEYYIMTATSVMQFGNGSSANDKHKRAGAPDANAVSQVALPGRLGRAIPTDIMNMPQWIHESTCFRVISNLSTFKYQHERKAMSRWRAAVRYIKFCRIKRRVEHQLLMVRPHFAEALRSAMRELHHFMENSPFELDARRASLLPNFAQKQTDQLEGRILHGLQHAGSSIGQGVVRATQALRKDLRQHKERLLRNKNIINVATKSMAEARLEKETTIRAIRTLEYDLLRLPDFCRMVNYVILGRMLHYIIDAYAQLVDFVATSSTGVFKVNVELRSEEVEVKRPEGEDDDDEDEEDEEEEDEDDDDADEDIDADGNGEQKTKRKKVKTTRVVFHAIDPTETEMFGAFTDFCTKLLATVDSFPLLMIPDRAASVEEMQPYDPEYARGTAENRLSEMTSLTATCADFDSLTDTFGQLYAVITQAYAEGNVFGTSVKDRFQEIYLGLTSFDAEAYVASRPDYLTLKRDLHMYQDWGKDIANMKLETKCGSLVIIETRSFKEALLAYLALPMDTCKAYLETLGHDQVIDLIAKYRKACTELEVDPNASLTSHAEYVEHYNVHVGAQKFHDRSFELVQDIYVLMKTFQVKHSIEDAARLEELAEEKTRFEESLARGRNHIAAHNNAYVDKLKAGITSMEEFCDQMTLQLTREPFNDPEQSPEEMVDILGKLKVKWDVQLEKAKQYAHQMELLVGGKKKPEDKPTTTYNFEVGAVENCRMLLERRQSIWGCLARWNADHDRWWNTDMTILLNPERNEDGLDGPQLERVVDEYFQEAVGYNRKYKGDEVVEILLAAIRVTRSKADFVALFGHPSLRERHYRQMYTEVFRIPFVDEKGIVHDPVIPEDEAAAAAAAAAQAAAEAQNAGGPQAEGGDLIAEKSKGTDADAEAEDPDPTVVTIAGMAEHGLFEEKNTEPLEEICGAAAKEYSLMKAMDKMEEDWEPLAFAVLEYKDTGTSIFRSMDEIEQTLDDQLVRTQAMRASRYIKTMEERCIAWEQRLKDLEAIISNRLAMQGTWLYLEPIFSSADICKQMPSEAKMFKKVDRLWRDSMEKTMEDLNVMAVFQQEGLLPKLKRANEMLDEIQKGLADYLNAKRVFFPRFFFLSNEELLEILSETKDPKRVQPHLIKCFEGISSLEFTNTMDIRAMISSEGEVVPFTYDEVKEKIINPNEAGGCVEIWLDQIQNIMRKTVAHVFDEAIVDYRDKDRIQWLQLWPGQVVLGVTQTYWTQECTAAISEGPAAVQAYADKLTGYINDIIQLVRGKIDKLVRKTVSPLVVLDVHARDVTEELARLGTSDPNDFDWLCQLRYYWYEGRASALSGDPGSVSCRMINAERLYGYEYLGNSMRLVITPLTDRCYRTLMGAVHLDYGGAPAGPAGTGKTETTKDLGKAIAIQCVVYNCSDSLDYKAMGKFFKGLAGTGAWACFDEFNRINLEVLSVVAQQILTISRAKVAKVDTFEFEGVMIKLRVTCNVFITMNPGYAGRQELPDNLKALFRDVAMMVPDYAMIGQIILYSMGYLEGFKLAKKIVMTYKLCSEQLSNQSHYDYGMRAVMAVLRAAGNLKQQQPEEDENILCLRSIIDVNLPKFLAPDVPLFNGIVSDLFPGIKLPDVDYSIMDSAIREVCREWRLDPTEYFLTKVHEVYEMMIVRHGFMVVGLPFAGKTTSLKMLQRVLTLLKERFPEDPRWTKVHTAIMNPKSITMGQLYGEFDPVSHEWTDGVLAIAYRNFSTNPPKIGAVEDRKWVWFDGPVDAIWIENMNTVLDDNKKLCLMNGEMIMMTPTMSMIFEPMDLEVASPATVSRVGVIYMEPFRVGWQPVLKSWLMKYGTLNLPPVFRIGIDDQEGTGDKAEEEEKNGGDGKKKPAKGKKDAAEEEDPDAPGFVLDEEQTRLLMTLCDWLIDPAISFLRKDCRSFVPTLDQTLVVSFLRLMEAMLLEATAAKVSIDQGMIENTFLFCLVWAVGGIVDAESRTLLSDFLRRFMKDATVVDVPEMKAVNTLLMLRGWKCPFESGSYEFLSPMPDEGLLFDYCFIGGGSKTIGSPEVKKSAKTWMSWTDTFVLPQLDKDAEFSSLVIPTKVTAQMERIVVLNLLNSFPVLVVGPTGTGKSMFIGQILSQSVDQDVYKTVPVAFTAKTSANQTQEIVDGKIDKRRRGIYGPPMGNKCVVFVDDLNMPEVEEYGAQPPIEILRQLVDNGGWFDLVEKDFHQIVDTQLISAMCPPGGSRNHITPRMLRHFSILCVSSFDGDTMKLIFNTILSWHMGAQDMPADVAGLSTRLVDATLQVYTQAIENLLPTPLKSHYTFNLRDFSRIVQGVMLVSRSDDFNAAGLRRLWIHETCRVMMDRLIDVDDQEWFVSALDEALADHLDEPGGVAAATRHLRADDDADATSGAEGGEGETVLDSLRKLFFGSYANPDNPKRPYVEVNDVPGLVPLMQDYLELYNAESKTPMDLVMFVFAIEHISRIARVLGMPRGNLLLVGVGGSGRQSLTRLAAFVADYSLIQVELAKNYTEVEWREDLQEVLKGAGTGSKPMVFLFCDTQIKYESFIEDINCMLNTGEVPNLFPLDVRMEILDRMQKIVKELGIKDASLNELWRMFIDRVRSRLHVVLAFSPIGSAFRDRLRKFPSLVNCCTIDWFFAWPKDALVAVARTFLGSVELDADVREEIVDTCQYMHLSISDLSERMRNELRRINYVTPTSYLELIRSFKGSLASCRDHVNGQRRRYEIGLEKLAFAAEQVGTMQQELTDLIPVLEKSKKETNELMAVIEQKLPGVEAMKKTVSEEAAIVQVQADECSAMKQECENDLAEAVPLLEDAMKALDTLKPGDITEVKAMKTPPAGVVLVMSAVCQMMGVKSERIKDPNDPTKKIEDYWGPSKKHLLGDPKFLQRLKDYDKDNISEKVIAILRAKYVNNPDFEPSKIKQASVAAFGLCKWVRAMESYDKVAKVVAPKKAKLKETEATLSETMDKLNQKKAELQTVVDDLAALETNLEEAKQKKDKLESDVDLCEKKLVRAKQLIDGLGGEKVRWTQNVADLKDEYVLLTGNVLISAGVIAYLGAFTAEYRDDVVERWTTLCREKKIPSKDDPSLFQTLGDPVTVRSWNVNGLPTDAFSVDNAIVLFNSRRWPLMIDPQGQANKWIRNLEGENGLKVIKLSDPNYMRTVENAVQFGSPVLLENIYEEIDPSFEPLLQKATFKQGGVQCIRLGDSVVEYSDSFRFYITTKLRNPHYLPEVAVKVTLLNFMITPAGLQDQMLAKVVKAEQPELAAEKERLIVDGANNAAKLKQCEDEILQILSSSSGNILEDESAIETLKSSKVLADDIKEKQAVAVVTEKKIDEVRAGYVPVAYHAQILYFCIADLANIEPTYQYSLEWFGNLFLKAIDDSEPCDDLEKRLDILNEFFTYTLYCNVCRSLLEKDKLLFSFLLCVRILFGRNEINGQEWLFLLTGGVATDNPYPNPCPEWLGEKGWGEICRLADLPAFSGLRESMAAFKSGFQAIYDAADAHQMPLPDTWEDKMSSFQKMLVLRCLRPDKVSLAVQDFVIEKMGDRFVKPPSFNLGACYSDASYLTPLVFVLSAGSDPMSAIIKLSEEIHARVESISLGQGQGIKAEAMIEKAQGAENEKIWVVLQNCHLAVSWMPALERIVELTSEATCNRQYRLWCTTYPTDDFPVSILQNSVKMTLEPPRGLRANILSSYLQDPIAEPGFMDMVVSRPVEWRKLLFSLSFFHAIVQERVKFGPSGYNVPYEFSESDRIISTRQLAEFLDLYDQLPFAALRYTCGQCNYGGRVTDDKDRRCLMSILNLFYNDGVLEDGYQFSPSGAYVMPEDTDHQGYLSYIEKLPLADKPDVFGLHENAAITKGIGETNLLFNSLLLCQKAEQAGGEEEEEEEKAGDDEEKDKAEVEKKEDEDATPAASGPMSDEDTIFSIADSILEKMPATYNMELAELKYPVRWEQSMNTVLCQELSRFNNLINCVVNSLKEVKKAVRGLVVMSEELEKVAQALLFGLVPKKWLASSYPSLKPLAGYVSDLLGRLDFFQKWLDDENGLPPPTFWISGFYFTQAFLTGSLQNFARKYGLEIDTIDFEFIMLSQDPHEVTEPPEDGVIVYGLFIDGARFCKERMILTESLPKVLISPAPMMLFQPCKKDDMKKSHVYEAPCYRTSERRGILSTTGHSTNFIMLISVPIDETKTQDTFIRGGVALLASTDD
ncbi:Dynein heavy chain 7, axonemal [Hondaea fermentalgiana]|uniref:Dynein heavy chain 7, axonemal n=1 Tax=Hondaea fermentalgiana TaxID=2315210 RepID=A0A2R5GQ89_9STRA|nr:Dynein heavy chain 7, axonemal [Hondaea fermentalgiana]|eukprot:GBG33042.1 Dynein heavy chain 7, axonemal [Hondaea fermentalgiana]